MRILVVTTDHPPMHGGIAQVSHQTPLHWAKQGHEVHVVASAEQIDAARAFDAAQPFTTKRVVGKHGRREWSLYRTLPAEIARFQPEVIWSVSWYPGAAAVSYVAPRGGGMQTVSTYASEILPNSFGWKQRLKGQLGFLRRRVFDRCEVIFAISRYTREKIIAIGAPAERIRIIPGAIGSDWFDVQRVEKREDAPPILLTVARLDEHKGHDMVIRALPAIRAQFPAMRYVIVGPGEENWPRLRAIAAECGVLDALDYRGVVPWDDVKRAYAEADVFVMPSREMPGRADLVEGFGLTFLEAAAVGLPSVAGNSGGVPDAVDDGATGTLVDAYSPAEIGAAVCAFFADPQYACRIGRQGRERAAAKFTWDRIATQMIEAFDERLVTRA